MTGFIRGFGMIGLTFGTNFQH